MGLINCTLKWKTNKGILRLHKSDTGVQYTLAGKPITAEEAGNLKGRFIGGEL